MINWRPFNHRPFTTVYDWAHKVRANDPAWRDFMREQDDRIIEAAFSAVPGVHFGGGAFKSGDAAEADRQEMIDETKKAPGRIRRAFSAVGSWGKKRVQFSATRGFIARKFRSEKTAAASA